MAFLLQAMTKAAGCLYMVISDCAENVCVQQILLSFSGVFEVAYLTEDTRFCCHCVWSVSCGLSVLLSSAVVYYKNDEMCSACGCADYYLFISL